MKLYKLKKKAFSLVEVILASSIILILVLGIAQGLSYSVEATARSNNFSIASYLANEGLEAVRNIRDENFANLTDGTYGLNLSSGRWSLSGSSDTKNIFTRSITISTVSPTTKRATVTINWQGKQTVLTQDFTTWQQLTLPPVPDDIGLLVYADNSGDDDIIRFKTLDESGDWSPQRTIPDLVPLAQPALRNLKLYNHPTNNTKILLAKFVLTPSTWIYAITWDGNSWGSPQLIVTYASVANPQTQNFDGDFINTGDFYLVYGNNTTTPQYRIWNGRFWSNPANTLNVGGNPNWISAKARPSSNEILVVTHDTSNDVNTMRWNGGSWTNLLEHTTNTTGSVYDSVQITWSRSNNSIALLTYPLSGNNNPLIRVWNGTSWSTVANNVNIGGQGRASRILSSPTSNLNLACYKDSVADINCMTTTTAGSWTATSPLEIENNTDAGNARSFDFAFEDQSGELAVIQYNGNPNPNQINSSQYSPSTNNWSAETSDSTNTGGVETVLAVPRKNSNDIMFMYGTTDQDVYTQVWNGITNAMYTTGGLSMTEHGTFGSDDLDFWFDFGWYPNPSPPSSIAMVQQSMTIGTGLSASQTAVFRDSVTVGNTVIVSISSFRNGLDCPFNAGNVTDNFSNTYTFVNQVNTTNTCIAMFYGNITNTGSNFTVTVDPPGTNQYSMTTAIHEYRGLATSATLDRNSVGSGTGTSVSLPNMSATTTANSLIFAIFTNNSTGTVEALPGNNHTLRTYYSNGTNMPSFSSDRIVSSIGTYNGEIQFVSSTGWRGVVAAFKAQ